MQVKPIIGTSIVEFNVHPTIAVSRYLHERAVGVLCTDSFKPESQVRKHSAEEHKYSEFVRGRILKIGESSGVLPWVALFCRRIWSGTADFMAICSGADPPSNSAIAFIVDSLTLFIPSGAKPQGADVIHSESACHVRGSPAMILLLSAEPVGDRARKAVLADGHE